MGVKGTEFRAARLVFRRWIEGARMDLISLSRPSESASRTRHSGFREASPSGSADAISAGVSDSWEEVRETSRADASSSQQAVGGMIENGLESSSLAPEHTKNEPSTRPTDPAPTCGSERAQGEV